MVPLSRPIPFWVDFLVFFGLMLVAIIFSVPGSLPGDLSALVGLALCFPMGVIGILTPSYGQWQSFENALILPAYGVYVVFLVLFARVRERPEVYVLWMAFALYLLMNAYGCREIARDLRSIH